MNQKIKLLCIGITMNPAGTEKSFLSFLSALDFSRYDVTLLLADRNGLFYPLIPKEVHVITMEHYGEMFTLNGGNAMKTIWNTVVKRNPSMLGVILPYVLKIIFHRGNRSDLTMGMWCALEKHFDDIEESYDVAIAYWGDKTMFYMLDHVKAKRKIAWLHFDYAKPPRDDRLYGPAFEGCDYIVTVSDAIDKSMKAYFPMLSSKIIRMENICNPRLIWDMALRGDTFPDTRFTGKRILTVGRICDQKGYDMVVEVLHRLREDGENVRWYILGDGDSRDVTTVKEMAVDLNVADMLILLGTTVNPYTYMRDCDIYAQPSRHEGKPISVEEAKILYKTILITDYTSANEQSEDGTLAHVVPISVDGIYEGVRTLLHTPSLCEAYSDRLTEKHFGNAEEISVFYHMTDGIEI